jgi:hypothetical protein
MNLNSTLAFYNQTDVEKLFVSKSISPNIDEYGNLVIENVDDDLFSSCITIPLVNAVAVTTKVESSTEVDFSEI